MAETEVLTELPAVAKTIYLECKKCEAERYHVVLAHTTATSAKVKCEVCGSTKSYKLPKAAKAKKVAAPKKPLKPGAKPRVTKQSKIDDHKAEYEKLMSGPGDTVKYNMKSSFPLHTKLDHPKFGKGVIRAAQADRIEVIFQDEIRNLVHNRG